MAYFQAIFSDGVSMLRSSWCWGKGYFFGKNTQKNYQIRLPCRTIFIFQIFISSSKIMLFFYYWITIAAFVKLCGFPQKNYQIPLPCRTCLYSRFSFPLAKLCYFVYYGITMEAFVFLKKKDAINFLKRWKNQKCSSPSEKNYWRRKPNS